MFKLPTMATGFAIFAIASSGTWVLAAPNPFTPSPALLAQSPNSSQSPRKAKRGDLLQQLNLTEKQKQQMSSIRQKYQSPMRQLHEQLRAAQDDLGQLMGGAGSESAIREKHQEISSLRQKLGDLRLDSMLEMRKVMTTEQRTQLSQLMKAKHDQRGQNRPSRGRPGQGRPSGPPPEDF